MLKPAKPHPPVAKRVDHYLEAHGHRRHDPYYWLRDDGREDPEVLAYLEAENRYTREVLKDSEAAQEQLFQEIIGRIKQDDHSVPVFVDGYHHYVRYEIGHEHPIYCRKRGSLDAAEEVLLNANREGAGLDFYEVGGLRTTRRGDFLAWAEDRLSRRIYTLRIEDLRSHERLESIEGTSGSFAWANDSETLFYVERETGTLRPHRVWRHRVGTAQSADVLVFEETDSTFRLAVYRSMSNQYILIKSSSTLRDEVRFIPANTPREPWRLFLEREAEHKYEPLPSGAGFYVLSNWQATNFRLLYVSEDRTSDKSAWREVVPERADALLEEALVFEHFIVLRERAEANTRLRILPLDDPGSGHLIAFDEPAYSTWIADNPSSQTELLRFEYSSLTTPLTTFDYDMRKRTRAMKKRQEVLGGFDPERYRSERLWVTARDGVRVPLSLVYRRDLDRSIPQPLYLYAYGSYGLSMPAQFVSQRLSLIDRGVIFAIAHVRGGSELGRHWYEAGKLLSKWNTFTDFVDAADWLIEQGYTARSRIVAAGGSAGGLLMGAVANAAADRFAAVIAHVPFVDVVTTMLDESIPLTTFEYDEWGNPHHEEHYHYMLSYSPYDNVRAQDYPHLLVMTGLHDSQVQYWEPAKWVAKLRSTKTDAHLLLFHTKLDAGHSGAAGRFERHRETALEYAFTLLALDLPLP